MSLHLTYNVKEPSNISGGQSSPPAIATGEHTVRSCWRPYQALSDGSAPSGEGAYMEGIPTRQIVFAVLFQKFLGVIL